MGLYDRDYTQDSFRQSHQYAPRMRMQFPKITPMVKRLLIINVVVFFISLLLPLNIKVPFHPVPLNFFDRWFSVFPLSGPMIFQPWRYITYQFLHANIGHIAFNMLCLYFLGPILERSWGSKKFLVFYLVCGVAGGLAYSLLVTVNFLYALPLVGASGSILGLFAACAILFPHFIVFFICPIRFAAIIFALLYTVFVLSKGRNAGGDAAHLGGMIAAALYVFSQGWLTKKIHKRTQGQWQKKMEYFRDLQSEVDRILEKVHKTGVHSLTRKEKKTLQKATAAQQRKDNK